MHVIVGVDVNAMVNVMVNVMVKVMVNVMVNFIVNYMVKGMINATYRLVPPSPVSTSLWSRPLPGSTPLPGLALSPVSPSLRSRPLPGPALSSPTLTNWEN